MGVGDGAGGNLTQRRRDAEEESLREDERFSM
jgi:hypothetical protein